MPAITLQEQLKKARLDLQEARLRLAGYDRELGQSKAALAQRDARILQLERELATAAQKILDLTKKLGDLTKARPTITVDELARQLRASVETLNSEVREKAAGGARLVVDAFEVEIRGGLDFRSGIRLTQLEPQEISPHSVSTIRFALRPVPVVRIAED